jgi:DNA-binding winged helix-turn-helix (wHTH) protein/tetratricopeptide (TPR) repeat protein/TolB-like protein
LPEPRRNEIRPERVAGKLRRFDPKEQTVSEPRRYHAADRLIDLDAREIRDGDAMLDVEAKVFDLIALLIEHRDRALSKREIGDALWGDRPVTDAALSQLLRKARRALGDDGDTQRAIRTVHGRGLQWVAPVVPVADPEPAAAPERAAAVAPAAPRTRRWPWFAVAAALVALIAVGFASRRQHDAQAAGSVPRVAVLPLADGTGEAELAWTSRGLMGLMTGLVEQRSAVEAVPAADVAAVAVPDAAGDAERVAALVRATGATHVLATSLAKVGSVYRLELRVLDADGGTRTDALHGASPAALAADAAARAREWLRGRAPAAATAAQAGIRDPFLAEAYARGLDAQLRGDNAGAKKYFDICVDHDPQLLWPRLRLAVAQGLTNEADAGVENATRVATLARERGDAEVLVEALRQLGAAAYRRGDMDTATRYLDDALARVPPGAPARLTIDLLVGHGAIDDERGRPRDARAHLERALDLARTSRDRRREANVLTNLAAVENAEGDAERAIARLREGLDAARAAGDGYLEGATLGNLGAAEFNAGRLLPATALLKQGLAIAQARSDRQLQVLTAVLLSWSLATFDRLEPAAQLAQQALSVGERENNAYWQAEAQWALAHVAARRGNDAEALTRYDAARAGYDAGGMQRNVAQVLAETVEAAVRAGDANRARAAADAYRALVAAAADDTQLKPRLPVIDAQLRWVSGDRAGAAAALVEFLDARGTDRGPAVQSALFQLGRWQLALGQGEALLRRPEWSTWTGQNPDALALRIDALVAAGQNDAAQTERERLKTLRAAAELDLDPALLAAPN